jgi:exo-beta-1,3-glucanase (GH17 family)
MGVEDDDGSVIANVAGEVRFPGVVVGQRSRRLASSQTNANWYGSGRVANASFWNGMRGIGFAPADDRGEWFMKRSDPSLARLDDALTKVVENGYNMIRTWRTGSYEQLVLQRIQERSLNIKVQLGVDIENDGHAIQLIDEAAAVASVYPELVLGLSVGNERMHFAGLFAETVREHVQYAKETYGIPVTYNFVVHTITHSRRRSKAAKALELCNDLDYVNVHLYGGHYESGRYDWSWTPRRQVEAVKLQESEVMGKIGGMGKPLIIGESGWQSRGYSASSIANLRNYYVLLTRHVYSNDADSLASAMFYFDLSDEAWKGGDDAWGLYEQGDVDQIGSSTGASKFTPTNVETILATHTCLMA